MELSKYNVFSKIVDSDQYFIINLLSGSVDILEEDAGKMLEAGQVPYEKEFAEKGYLVDQEEEQKLYRRKYMEFMDSRDDDEVQIFFVPQYTCNFSCTYCFQEEYDFSISPLKPEVTEAFFAHIDNEFAGRRKYITLFGGEPLLPGESHRRALEHFLTLANERNLEIAVVTNGYTLEEYLPILSMARIRELQVTLDGPQDIHDQRRTKKGGGSSFDKIVKGIDAAIENKITINLRMVVDKQNMPHLAELSRFAIEKGWTKSPYFKTQLGRNYELHSCQLDHERLYSRVGMYQELYKLVQEYPEILEFHKPAFSVSRFLWENGEAPHPLFDSCTGATTEWAFDFEGRIFSCTATVGKQGEELGKFYPQKELYSDIIDQWEDRDVTTIPECKDCSAQLLCGGGCTSVAKNQSGKIHSPDCRPVKELMELGLSLYFNHPNKKVEECLIK
jgi:uncharacterized protein